MAELLYEGKAKQVYKTEKEDEYLIHYKDCLLYTSWRSRWLLSGMKYENISLMIAQEIVSKMMGKTMGDIADSENMSLQKYYLCLLYTSIACIHGRSIDLLHL